MFTARVFVFVLSLIASISFIKANFNQEAILLKMKPDNIVKSGDITVKGAHLSDSESILTLNYRFQYSILFSTKTKNGNVQQVIPRKFTEEQGFIDLEREKIYRDEKVILKHLGRTNWELLYDCHKVKMIPVQNSKWEATFTYCPEIPSAGWAKVDLLYKNIPFLGSRTFYAHYVRALK